MDLSLNTQNNKIERAFAWFKHFVYTPYFSLTIAVITLLSYLFGIQYVGFFFYTIFACLIFLTINDVWPIVPMLLSVTFLFRTLDFSNPIFIAMLAPIGVCFIARFFIYKIKTFIDGYLFLPLVLVSIVLFAGGLFSDHMIDWPKGLVTSITIGPVLLFIYWFFRQHLNTPKDFDLKSAFFNTLLLCGIVVAFEVIFHEYHCKILQDNLFAKSDMGWANINSASVIIMISSPACFYFMLKNEKILPSLLLAVFLIIASLISSSDACVLIQLIFNALMLVGVFVKLKTRRLKIALVLYCFGLALLIAVYFYLNKELLDSIIEKFFQSSSSDNGRTPLYLEAWELFTRNPMFGASLGYYNDAVWMHELALTFSYFFHSTLFQVLACTGVVGLTAYVYYFVQRYRILTAKSTYFNYLCYVAFTMFEIYGFIDAIEFSIIPHMIFATLIIVIVEINNQKIPPYKTSVPLY